MARPRIYHNDRPATAAEYARASRARRRARQETGQETPRQETPRQKTPRQETRQETPRLGRPRVPSPARTTSRRPDVGLKVRARLKEHGISPADRTKVLQIIGDLYPGREEKQAALKAYDRALPATAVLNRWLSLAWHWGRTYEAYDVVFELIALATPARFELLAEHFDSIEQQWGGEDKFSQLRKLRDKLRAYPYNFPKRRPQRGNSAAIVEAILALMRRNPKRFWSRPELAEKLGKSVKAIWHLTTEMCNRGLIKVIDEGLGLLALREVDAPKIKTVSGRIIEWLITNGPTPFSKVARGIEVEPVAMSTQVGTLRRIGVLAPADAKVPLSQRGPLKLSAAALAKIDHRQTIRDRRGFILWAPADTGQN